MPIGVASLGFGFAAGLLSTLSPCVLPLLPLVLTGAASAHRFGMAALTAGLALSFVTLGLFVATIGFSIGLTGDLFRSISAVLLAILGAVLLSGALQARFAGATSTFADAGNQLLSRLSPSGLTGQFLVGLMLGAIWSPCVGPTLGAASVLAAQGKDLTSVALIMAAFALGTALPLLVVGSLSRITLRRWQGSMMGAGKLGKQLLGATLLATALLILTGADHALEAGLVTASPAWLTDLTTRF
jgi:cytochrome c-type biogenesis protein